MSTTTKFERKRSSSVWAVNQQKTGRTRDVHSGWSSVLLRNAPKVRDLTTCSTYCGYVYTLLSHHMACVWFVSDYYIVYHIRSNGLYTRFIFDRCWNIKLHKIF